MTHCLLCLFLVFGLFGTQALAQNTANQITFEIDMRDAIAEGWFDPTTDQVGIRGSQTPLSWGQSMLASDENADNVFIVIVSFDPVLTDSIQVAYKFKVEKTGNDNDGWETGRNRAFVLTGELQTIARRYNEQPAPLPETFTGTIIKHPSVASQFLEANRDVFVYLPPGYANNPDQYYPVFYMHDGRNVFDASEVGAEWRVDETAQHLITEGLMEPIIIVGVGNTASRTHEYTPTESQFGMTWPRIDTPQPLASNDTLSALTGRYRIDQAQTLVISMQENTLYSALENDGDPVPLTPVGSRRYYAEAPNVYLTFDINADGEIHQILMRNPPAGGRGPQYGRFLVDELLPFINAEYRTQTGPAHTAVGGSSLGGLISMYLGLEYPDVFGHLAVISPSVWWDQRVILSMVADKPKSAQRIWLDMGTAEGAGMLNGARDLKAALEVKGWQEGVDLAYMEDADATHSETAWAGRAEAILRFLFPPKP